MKKVTECCILRKAEMCMCVRACGLLTDDRSSEMRDRFKSWLDNCCSWLVSRRELDRTHMNTVKMQVHTGKSCFSNFYLSWLFCVFSTRADVILKHHSRPDCGSKFQENLQKCDSTSSRKPED